VPPAGRPRRPVGRVLGRLALAVLVLALGGGAAWAVNVASRPGPQVNVAPQFVIEREFVDPGSSVPGSAGAVPPPTQNPAVSNPAQHPGQPPTDASTSESVTAWVNRISGSTDIPPRVLRAYANADLMMRADQPSCRLSWTMLAGIGHVESHHGRYGGASIDAGGRETIPVIGVQLDGGTGFQRIPDTDHGTLDGDPTWDHAVGPMQFLPGTWRKWGARASRDGNPPDPQNIDDAALTAGRYLCSGGRDLATPKGWWDGVLSYNNSVDYGQQVFSAADAYARASLAAR
jgi:membrane-bound lytic murein transglycosylase B